MTQFVIRSMTTTDYDFRRPSTPVVPYHIYLLPSHKRRGAYWSSKWEAERFDTIEAAEAEVARSLPVRDKWDSRPEIVPVNDDNIPTFWDNQKLRDSVRSMN
jgi:hypothetical protein